MDSNSLKFAQVVNGITSAQNIEKFELAGNLGAGFCQLGNAHVS